MAKFCTNCGSELNPGVKFCENCGQKGSRSKISRRELELELLLLPVLQPVLPAVVI